MSPFEVTIEKMRFLLTYFGITLNKSIKKTKIIYRRVFIFNVFWVISDTFGGILVIINGLITDGGLVNVTYMAPCTTLTFMSFSKAILFIYYEENISNLAANLSKLDQKHNTDILKVQSDVNFIENILKSSNILNVMLWVIFSFSPLAVSCYFYWSSGVFEVLFPCLILYPFDAYNPVIWPFVYIHQIISVGIVLLNIQGPDYFLYICLTYLRIQFRLLCCDLKQTINDTYSLPHQCFQKKCIPLIQWHQHLIKIASELESVYTKSTLIHFMSASLLICLTGFNVVEISNPAVTMMFLVFLSTNLSQIFLLCYLGDLLMNSTMEVREAIYDTKWYAMDSISRKSLIIIHYRAQKACKLTAFGFSDVSLKSFTSILSTAWSYFALLKSVSSPTKT